MRHAGEGDEQEAQGEAVDADFTFEEAVRGREEEARAAGVVLLGVRYLGLDGRPRRGQIVVARTLAAEVAEAFEEVLAARFPLASVIPVAAFGWSDAASMEANNSSAFNPREIAGGGRPSHHSTGHAVDLNPALNPYSKGSITLPPGASYNPSRPGTLTPDSAPVRAFESRGWTWGGRWQSPLDLHHFEKS